MRNDSSSQTGHDLETTSALLEFVSFPQCTLLQNSHNMNPASLAVTIFKTRDWVSGMSKSPRSRKEVGH